MTQLILMIGLPGSGKSYLAQYLITDCPRRQLISTDAIRAKLFGEESIQGPWLLVWREVQHQFQQARIHAPSAIYDATNAARKQRREAIVLAREAGFTHITGLWLETPLKVCLQRNRQRGRQVPEEVILRMHRQLSDAPPALQDGLDQLIRWSPAGISTEIAVTS